MFREASRFEWLLVWVLAALFAVDAQAQAPHSKTKVITWQTSQNSNDIQVGILGEIARPGVYRLDAASLSAQALVRRAGGLTEEASLTIRILRHDRVVQDLFFTTQADTRLHPGDLLVVESKRAMSATSKVLDRDSRPGDIQLATGTVPDAPGVQVAFLNVLDAPVIVKLRPEEARIENIVLMLGQPIELAGAVKVLSPDRVSALQTLSNTAPRSLADGSVIVFPKNSINRNKLPPLPRPYESAIASGALPSLIGGSSGQSAELRSVGQLAPLIAMPVREQGLPTAPSTNDAPLVPVTPPSFSVAPRPPEFDEQPSQVPVVSTPPRIATLPFTGVPRLRTSSSRERIDDESGSTTRDNSPGSAPHDVDGAVGSPGVTKSPKAEYIQREQQLAASSNSSSPFSLLQMLGILSVVATLIGAAILVRRHFEPLTAQQPQSASKLRPSVKPSLPSRESAVEPTATTTPGVVVTDEPSLTTAQDNALERLIRNQLPLREEPLMFPEPIVLQGRIAPRPMLRVDKPVSPVTGSGPHFANAAVASTDHTHEVISTPAAAHDTLATGPHFGRRRSGTPLATIVADSHEKSPPQSDAPRPTPLTDALRQLQGDRIS